MWRAQTYLALLAMLCGVILWNKVPSFLDFSKDPAIEVWLVRLCIFSATGSAYFSLRASLRYDSYHSLNFLFVLLYVAMLGFFTWQQFTAFKDLNRFIYQGDLQENHYVRSLSDQAISGETEEMRQRMARAAFRIYGLTIAYKSDSGQLLFHTPDEEDLRERASIQASDTSAESGIKMFEEKLKNHPLGVTRAVLVMGGMFLLFFGIDILWIVFLRPWKES